MKSKAKKIISKTKHAIRNKVRNKEQKFSRLDTHDDDGSNDEEDDAKDDEFDFREEAGLFLNLAAPNVIIQLMQFSLWFTNAVVAGQWLGTEELAAVSLANLSGNLTGLSIVFGMLSALDTLVPQAVGAGNFAEVGILTQRATILCFIISIPCLVVWLKIEDILLFFDQPPTSVHLAARFLKVG